MIFSANAQKELFDTWENFKESYVKAAVNMAERFEQAITEAEEQHEVGVGALGDKIYWGERHPLSAKTKKEVTMQVTYNGFTGELVKLEQTHYGDCRYSLSIYDDEKKVTHSFTGVKLEDVKFSGGAVSFCG